MRRLDAVALPDEERIAQRVAQAVQRDRDRRDETCPGRHPSCAGHFPTMQVRLATLASEAPSLIGAMTLAACNLGDPIGAWDGGAR